VIAMRQQPAGHDNESVPRTGQDSHRSGSIGVHGARSQKVRRIELREKLPHLLSRDFGVARKELPGRVLDPHVPTEIGLKCFQVTWQRFHQNVVYIDTDPKDPGH
jgi:hypothetical protein